DGCPQQGVDEFFQDNLAGHRLRDLEDGRELQVFDGRADRRRRAGRRLLVPGVWERLVELSNLAIGSPAKVALARLPQIHSRDLLEAARRVEARRQFAGERLVVDEAVGGSRADGRLVEAHPRAVAAAATAAEYSPAKKRAWSLRMEYQHSASAKSGFAAKRRSISGSSN